MNSPDPIQPSSTLPPLGTSLPPLPPPPPPSSTPAPAPAAPPFDQETQPQAPTDPAADQAQEEELPVEASSTPAPAPDAQPSQLVSSHEKVKLAIEEYAALKGPAMQVFITPLIGQLNLPEDPAQLDAILVDAAQLILHLRSDGAPQAVLSVSEKTEDAR